MPEDRRVVERALAAWEEADLGLRFALGGPPADIEIGFGTPPGARSGVAAVECAATPGPGPRVEARLVHAVITLVREELDWRGQRVPLDEAQRVGAALHELGHALGFQGHPRRGDTVMVRSLDRVRRAGRDILRGRPFSDVALHALYALPSGEVLGRWRLPGGRTRGLDALRATATRAGFAGPLVRVGDRGARIAWRDGGGEDVAVFLPDVRAILRDPTRNFPDLAAPR